MIVCFTDECTSGRAFAEHIFKTVYGIPAPQFERGEHGKPRLTDEPLFFSLSHSHGRTFLAVAQEEIGLDAEWRGRPLPRAYLSRLTPAEREEDFFRLWTAKEAYVKFRGGTLADMLPALRFEHGVLLGHGTPVSASLAFCDADGYALALCCASKQRIELVHAPSA